MSKLRLAVTGVVIVLAIGFLLSRVGQASVYFKTADEAVAQRDDLGAQRFRVEGNVVPGSVKPTEGGVRFVIAGTRSQVAVVHQGDPPDLFQPGIPVVLEGHWDGTHFASDRILVKHSEEYRAKHPSRVKGAPANQ